MMSNLSPEQQEHATLSKKGFAIWAAVVGLITTALVYWILDEYTNGLRIGAAVAGGVVVAIAMYRKSVKKGLKSDAQDGGETK
jgi:Na+/H+ antiporter NhaA